MPIKWVRRRAHNRMLNNGTTSNVSAAWVPYKMGRKRQSNSSYRHQCPECGTEIISVRMPNGGMAHFEGRRELARVKHPCLNRGEGLSNSRDPDTPDLFQDNNI